MHYTLWHCVCILWSHYGARRAQHTYSLAPCAFLATSFRVGVGCWGWYTLCPLSHCDGGRRKWGRSRGRGGGWGVILAEVDAMEVEVKTRRCWHLPLLRSPRCAGLMLTWCADKAWLEEGRRRLRFRDGIKDLWGQGNGRKWRGWRGGSRWRTWWTNWRSFSAKSSGATGRHI